MSIRKTILVLAGALLVACATAPTDDNARLSEKAAQNTPPFDPSWDVDPQQTHAALFFEIENGRLRLLDQPAERRPGRMPYDNRSGGPIAIVYLDQSGEEIGRYGSEHPATSRACAHESVSRIARLERGTVEILIPADPDIATLRLEWEEGSREFDAHAQMQGMR